MTRTLTVSLAQYPCAASPDHNLALAIAHIQQAAAAGADLLLLPELHLGRYFCQRQDPGQFAQAQPIPGPATAQLAAAAAAARLVVVASLFERRAAGLYHNTALVFDGDGHIAGQYRKMHIPDDPGFNEKFYFTPGDLGFKPIPIQVGGLGVLKLGVLVCWDQWFPEAARLMALAGADLLLYPTAIGWDLADSQAEQQRQLEAWLTCQRAHAIANGLPVLACNRIGFEPAPDGNGGIAFWGNSFAVGPQGEWLARASADQAGLLTVSLDLARSEQVRRIWPFLRDRRIDAYGGLSQRWLD